MKLVVDSSVIVKWIHQEEEQYLEHADRILQDVRDGSVTIIIPELAKYEVGNALLLSKKVSLDEAVVLLGSLFSLPIQFVAQSVESANETYQIARDCRITYYDATFMALAKIENATLITDNVKHQGRKSGIKVISLKDY